MRRLLLLLAVTALGGFIAERALAVNANPTPGSVWTYYGPTFGADWGQIPPNGQVTMIGNYGAVCDGVADDTTPIQAAVNANPTGIIGFPNATCLITHTITLAKSHITLQGMMAPAGSYWAGSASGGSLIMCRTVTTPCFATAPTGGDDTTDHLTGVNFRNLTIDGTGQTCCEAIRYAGVANSVIEDVWIAYPWNGILFYNISNVLYRRGQILLPHGGWAIRYDTDLTTRSDTLILEDIIANCNFSGADGIQWDGFSQTLSLRHGAMLNCRYGLYVANGRGSTTSFPQHLQAYGWAVDGASASAVSIQGGSDFHFTDMVLDNAPGRAGQGNADGPVFFVNADLGKSNTNSIFITSSLISSGSKQCAFIDATIVMVTGSNIAACGIGHAGNFATLEFGPNSQHQVLAGNVFYPSGNANYAVLVDSGGTAYAGTLALNGNDFFTAATAGGIFDAGAAGVNTIIHESGSACGAVSGTTISVVFNRPFPTALSAITLAPGGGWPGAYSITAKSTTGFTVSYTGGAGISYCFDWQADGT